MERTTILITMKDGTEYVGVKVNGYKCDLHGFPGVVHHPVLYDEKQKSYHVATGWRVSDPVTGYGYSGAHSKKTRQQAIHFVADRIANTSYFKEGTLGSHIMELAAEFDHVKIIDLTGD